MAGNTMFLPKYLYESANKREYETLKSLIDVSLTNEEWFISKIRSAISNILEFRLFHEKRMSEGELRVFDQDYAELFSPEIMGLVLRFETHAEESLARNMAGLEDKELSTNDTIDSEYLDIKKEVKNPRALKMLNNLIMSHNVINDRLDEIRKGDYNRNHLTEFDDVTNEERNDI